MAGPTSDLAGRGRGLQPLRGVHDVAHRGVVAAGPQRADQHLAGVDADAHLRSRARGLGAVARRASACIRSAARTARSASSSWATGAPNRARIASPMILSTRPPNAVMSATRRSKHASTRFLTVLGVAGLGERGEPDEVGEQHGDDPALVAARPQRRARTTSRTGRPSGTMAPHDGHVMPRAYGRSTPPSTDVVRPESRHAGRTQGQLRSWRDARREVLMTMSTLTSTDPPPHPPRPRPAPSTPSRSTAAATPRSAPSTA